MKSFEEIKDYVIEFFSDEELVKGDITLETDITEYTGWSPAEIFDVLLMFHFRIILPYWKYPNVITVKDYIDLIVANQK
jgi:acyl carrier protein